MRTSWLSTTQFRGDRSRFRVVHLQGMAPKGWGNLHYLLSLPSTELPKTFFLESTFS